MAAIWFLDALESGEGVDVRLRVGSFVYVPHPPVVVEDDKLPRVRLRGGSFDFVGLPPKSGWSVVVRKFLSRGTAKS